jgi:hypothetical protein
MTTPPAPSLVAVLTAVLAMPVWDPLRQALLTATRNIRDSLPREMVRGDLSKKQRTIAWLTTSHIFRSSLPAVTRTKEDLLQKKCSRFRISHRAIAQRKSLILKMAERQGFEPWIPCGIHAFQAFCYEIA